MDVTINLECTIETQIWLQICKYSRWQPLLTGGEERCIRHRPKDILRLPLSPPRITAGESQSVKSEVDGISGSNTSGSDTRWINFVLQLWKFSISLIYSLCSRVRLTKYALEIANINLWQRQLCQEKQALVWTYSGDYIVRHSVYSSIAITFKSHGVTGP